MDNTKRNALAELAEQMNNEYVALVVNGKQVATFSIHAVPALDKAQRIIAELAKIGIRNEGVSAMSALWNCNDCIVRCREIAEEGGTR